jgi:hypothetical protein
MEYYTHVGWVSVIVGAALSFLLGWLWYSPKMFGVKWAEGSGVKMDGAGKMPAEAMATQGVGLLMMSWFVNVAGGNAGLRALIAFGVLAYSGSSFTGKSHYAKLVDAGYWVASFAVMMLVRKVLGGM